MNQPEAENRYRLRIQTTRIGRDYLILIAGGEEHIGAVAVSYMRNGKPVTETKVLPGHREEELAAAYAEEAALRLGAAVTVVAGIHIDRATREDIEQILVDTDKLFHSELNLLVEKIKNNDNLS